MHNDDIEKLRKQSLLGEPYGSEHNLWDPEKPEAFIFDAELLNRLVLGPVRTRME